MSIWSDHAIKELQEKVAWMEKALTDFVPLMQRQEEIIGRLESRLEQIIKAEKADSPRESGTLSRVNGPRKPS